jgi:hypothetical protein
MSDFPDVFSSCSMQSAAVSGNWLSTATMPAGLINHPIVPPRAVQYPVLRLSSLNTGVTAAGGCCAASRPKVPAAKAAVEVARKWRREMVMGE